MKLKDIFSETFVRLEQLNFNNKSEFSEELNLNFGAHDFIETVPFEDETIVYNRYRRVVKTTDDNLVIEVVYGIFSRLKDEIDTNREDIQEIINEDLEDYLRIIPSEASFSISSITKCAGLPPLVTKPEFLESK